MDRNQLIANLRLPLNRLPDPLGIPVVQRPFNVTIKPPGSKSLTNRALLLAALADGESVLRNPLIDAADARVMITALRRLGARIVERDGSLHVTGVGGCWRVPPAGVTLGLSNAGTATRFLTAAVLLAPPGSGGITIDGNGRMRQRPIGELGDALVSLGASVEYLGAPGFPPLRIRPASDPTRLAGSVTFARTSSSQFISAMLLIAPLLPNGLTIELVGDMTSAPYVHMSVQLLRRIGVHSSGPPLPRSPWAERRTDVKPFVYSVAHQRLASFELDIEADASGASYFLAAAALVPHARCVIDGLPPPLRRVADDGCSLQGDARFGVVLWGMGADECADDHSTQATGPAALKPIAHDLSGMPDTAMTAAVLAAFASPTADNASATTTLHGLRTLRVKETDRITALVTELARVDVRVEPVAVDDDESLRITPPAGGLDGSPSAPRVEFDTYDDHRMAMSLALIGLRRPNVFIRNPACVAKTYPCFWTDLAKLYEQS